MLIRTAIVAGLMTAGASAAARGAVVYTQNPDPSDGTASQDPFIVADNFTLASAQTIRSITFWGGYGFSNTPQAEDVFTVRFYADAGGVPASGPIVTSTLRGLTRTATGGLIAGVLDEYVYVADLGTQVSLSAGTTYWISIANDTSVDPNDDWFWEESVPVDVANATSNDTGATWTPDNDDQAFRLHNNLMFPPECEGANLFFQQLPDASQAVISDSDPGLEVAEMFIPATDVLVRDVRFWGSYGFGFTPPATETFHIRVFEDAAGLPGDVAPFAEIELVDLVRASTGGLIGPTPEHLYTARLAQPLMLEAGEVYWVAILNDTTSDPNDDWFWEYSGTGDGSYARHNIGAAWSFDTGDLALEICGDELPNLSCLADLSGNGSVGAEDLALLLGAWGACP